MQEPKAAAVLNKMVQTTNEWIKDLMYELGLTEPDQAYHVIRATIQALRDRLPPDDAVHMAAQLPTILRGTFYDGWKITGKPIKIKTKEEFFNHVEQIHNVPLPVATEDAVRAVFKILHHYLSNGEIEKVETNMPLQLQELWPQKAVL